MSNALNCPTFSKKRAIKVIKTFTFEMTKL